jgi:RHS repeat-associated protein
VEIQASNLATITDPLGHSTSNTYDQFGNVTTVVDPNLARTRYYYDVANNLTEVDDPRYSITTYAYDGLNNLLQQVSPDTGMTISAYDAAGNLLTRTDGDGATATYTYDVLNRATQVVYSKSGTPSETHIFTYDGGANAKGKLTQVTDPAATTIWTYNSQGRIASKVQQVGSVSRALSYGYNGAGQLSTITTPSGQQIGYIYTNNRVTRITINGQALITGAATEPFGPLALWFWGNGLRMYRDFDNDGRLITWEFRNGTSILQKDQSFDLAGRITAITDPSNPAASQTYQYDALDRLTVAQTGSPVTRTQQFTYDAVGNRLNATSDSATANLFYDPWTNKLQALVGAISANHYNGATALAFTYNNANRLVAIQSSGLPLASYAVSALGQRVSKTVGGVTTLFVYDEQGHLLGEYDGSGNLIQETVWLEDLPVATLRPTGTGNPTPIAIYYVHADHLGSPRAVTRPADNAIMWQWDNLDPFGANAANENPSGQGMFKYGMRFPGQYYDSEIGTNYNYFRDYDSTIGRYLQSDPIGLKGGLNTFAYVRGQPIRRLDPLGLVEWRGKMRSKGFMSGSRDVFTLTSECACGRETEVTVEAEGFSYGGPRFGITVNAESAVTLTDKSVCANALVLEGAYLKIGFGYGSGYGVGFNFLIVGGASSPGGFGAETADFDFSLGTVIGKSTVTDVKTSECKCSWMNL